MLLRGQPRQRLEVRTAALEADDSAECAPEGDLLPIHDRLSLDHGAWLLVRPALFPQLLHLE